MRRERYVGDWLPEPLPDAVLGRPDAAADPADRVSLSESVTMAFLVVLDAMTPAERVAFILHDVFGYPFTEIAQIVGRSPGACRQLASSARSRVRAARPDRHAAAGTAEVVRDFETAWRTKDINALVGLLDPGVVATADSGGRAPAFVEPLVGRDAVLAVWLQLAEHIGEMTLHERPVNGQPGLIATQQDGTTVSVYAFDIVDGHIRHIWVTRNPEKLGAWGR